MAQDKPLYIPAGCICITKAQTTCNGDLWDLEELHEWNALQLQDGHTLPESQHDSVSQNRWLRPDFQSALLQADGMGPLARLFRAQWIKLEFKINLDANDCGNMRVYLLPDDVCRRSIDRTDHRLRKARIHVLDALDFSKDAWSGLKVASQHNRPTLFDDLGERDEEELSLLQLFNKIPSPSPEPESIFDRDYQDAVYDILESKITGLSTELYAYQRRSAALMLQKEAQPSQVLDPRLLHTQDQCGSSWYLDPIVGTVLLEPRYYDGIPGGVLAEEMGSGKTLMCLALILATRHLPTQPPELYRPGELPVRKQVGSLVEMAAACVNRFSVAWKPYFGAFKTNFELDFDRCIDALERNPGYYHIPAPEPRRVGRHPSNHEDPPTRIYMSAASIIVVPNNLVSQWIQEIHKHTAGLEVVLITGKAEVPEMEVLRKCDIILFSQSRFETLVKQFGGLRATPLSQLHFKRCIVDEGHKLGNSKIGHRSNLLIGLDTLKFSSRWIVTGTPSRGLFGVDTGQEANDETNLQIIEAGGLNTTSNTLEKEDLERIGAITALYLKARPWANTTDEVGDTTADWTTYLMLPKHNPKGRGRWDSLKTTLNSLIIRHKLSEIGNLLPPVDERVVVLEGSYQDRLSLNIFSMMIVFNTVQSQRTDMDYFFHPKQKKSLLQIVHNLKQSSFFGGSFFTSAEIATSVKTAEDFLSEGKIPISPEDKQLLLDAISLGRLAIENQLRNLSNQFHEIPVTVADFPARSGSAWSLDGQSGDVICTSASMLLAVQKLIYNAAKEPEELNSLLNGGLMHAGMLERDKILAAESVKISASEGKDGKSQTLAGNTKLGDDSPRKTRSHGVNGVKAERKINADVFSGPLELTKILSTASAKLSYLLDSIIKHQEQEKIIVFYENENVAWYLASMLDVLQVQHLIYAKTLSTERRSQYVNTFHQNPVFRVLLMDLSQAAFGLDMREASRIYFINPVLNPQVEAQAIGRVRRISQRKPVSVETLVLKDSIDEVILDRKKHMSQAEHRHVKSLLDVRPIYNWIKNASIIPMPDPAAQFALLSNPQQVFGRGFGKSTDPDDGIILAGVSSEKTQNATGDGSTPTTNGTNGLKRAHEQGPGSSGLGKDDQGIGTKQDLPSHVPRKVRFASDADD